MIRTLDLDALNAQFVNAAPFPHIVIDDFIESDKAREIAQSYPAFEDVQKIGVGFESVNEHRKIQVTDYEAFPDQAKALADTLGSEAFLTQLSKITGIPNLIWDEQLLGGGMHQTASSGILDVHVDFNLIEARQLFRRLNILVYLNDEWKEDWGGVLELWDRDVKVRHHAVMPALGRAVIFETSEISFHGVTAVSCPPAKARKSFAAYYYTKEPPPGYAGKSHSTIFKARPNELHKRYVTMPLEQLEQQAKKGFAALKSGVKSILPR